MKLSVKLLAAVCAISVLASGLAMAQTGPAVFMSTDECGMLDETGDGFIVTEGVQISANSANGNVTLICSAKLGRLDIKRSVIWNYDNTFDNPINQGLCGTFEGTTDDWHQVITPSGNFKLTCHLKSTD